MGHISRLIHYCIIFISCDYVTSKHAIFKFKLRKMKKTKGNLNWKKFTKNLKQILPLKKTKMTLKVWRDLWKLRRKRQEKLELRKLWKISKATYLNYRELNYRTWNIAIKIIAILIYRESELSRIQNITPQKELNFPFPQTPKLNLPNPNPSPPTHNPQSPFQIQN